MEPEKVQSIGETSLTMLSMMRWGIGRLCHSLNVSLVDFSTSAKKMSRMRRFTSLS